MFIFALTPVVVATLVPLTPLILSAAGGIGYKITSELKEGGELNDELKRRLNEDLTITIDLDLIVAENMEEEIVRAQALFFEKGDVTLAVMKDERNKLVVKASAPSGHDKRQLQDEGRLFAEELSQLFAQSRIVDQLERLNAQVAEEEVTEEGEIKLTIRRWV